MMLEFVTMYSANDDLLHVVTGPWSHRLSSIRQVVFTIYQYAPDSVRLLSFTSKTGTLRQSPHSNVNGQSHVFVGGSDRNRRPKRRE